MKYNIKTLLILLVLNSVISIVIHATDLEKYSAGKTNSFNISFAYRGNSNITENDIVIEKQDIDMSEIVKDSTLLISNIIPIERHPEVMNNNPSTNNLQYFYSQIVKDGKLVGISQKITIDTPQEKNKILYENAKLMLNNIIHSQLFFEREVEGIQRLYFAHFVVEEILNVFSYEEKYFIVVQVIEPASEKLLISKRLAIPNGSYHPTKSYFKRTRDRFYDFTQAFIRRIEVDRVVVADDGTLYINTVLVSDFDMKGLISAHGEHFRASQIFHITELQIEEIYATYDSYIANLFIDNNNVLYFLEETSDTRKDENRNDINTVNRGSGGGGVVAVTKEKVHWQIHCPTNTFDGEEGCFDLQLDTNGSMYLLPSVFSSAWYIDYGDRDTIATIYTLATNATGLGGYTVSALHHSTLENESIPIIYPRTIGKILFSKKDVNIINNFASPVREVVYTLEEGETIAFTARTRDRYGHDNPQYQEGYKGYWYKGYVLDKEGNVKQTENGERISGWVNDYNIILAVRNTGGDEAIYKRTLGDIQDDNVNVRSGYGLEHEVVFQVHTKDKMELIKRTKKKYSIGEMNDYWYKGYLLVRDDESRAQKRGKEQLGWVYGAFLDVIEIDTTEDITLPEKIIGIVKIENAEITWAKRTNSRTILKLTKGDKIELFKRSAYKHTIEDTLNYWYKGYALEEDGITRKTNEGAELEGWIFGANINNNEVVRMARTEKLSKKDISNNTPSQNMLLLISSGIALLLVGLGVIIIVRKKQNKKTNTKEDL